MSLLLPGELAWYVTGRFYARPDGSLADYGYFLHLAGIEASLFGGSPGEATAHFTFAAEPFTAVTAPSAFRSIRSAIFRSICRLSLAEISTSHRASRGASVSPRSGASASSSARPSTAAVPVPRSR